MFLWHYYHKLLHHIQGLTPAHFIQATSGFSYSMCYTRMTLSQGVSDPYESISVISPWATLLIDTMPQLPPRSYTTTSPQEYSPKPFTIFHTIMFNRGFTGFLTHHSSTNLDSAKGFYIQVNILHHSRVITQT